MKILGVVLTLLAPFAAAAVPNSQKCCLDGATKRLDKGQDRSVAKYGNGKDPGMNKRCHAWCADDGRTKFELCRRASKPFSFEGPIKS